MKRIYIICLLVFLYGTGKAQNIISGTVTNQNNEPLAGANIYLPELNKGTVADINGKYSLKDLSNGKIKVQFSYLGYTSRIETVILKNSNAEVNVSLHQAPIETEGIVVTGGYNSTQHENAVKIDIVHLDSKNLKSTPNFMEALTKVSGVDMISKGSGISKPVIRGLSMNDILVLDNGVRFENYQYSSHHPLGIDEFGIESVEIIKGPASLLYGSDAIGGVINFIKERPAPVNSVTGDYNLALHSNTRGITSNLGIKGSSGKFFGGLRAGFKYNSDFLQGGGAYAPNTRFNEYAVSTNVGYTGKTGTFRLFYDYNRQNLGLAEEEALEQISERSYKCDIFYQQLNTHLLSSQNKLFLGKTKLDLNTSYQNTELIHFGEENEYELQMKLATLSYEAKVHLPSDEASEYIVGFQGMNQFNANLNNRETILLPDATTNNQSLFALVQKTFFSNLKTQAGIRYDLKQINTEVVGSPESSGYREALNKNYGSFSGSIGATYNFSGKLLLRGNIASAYRTPNLAELTSNGAHETRYEIGDNSLVPEKSVEYDLSMHFHADNLTFDITGYFNNINNYIFISPTGEESESGLPIYRYMQQDSHLFGGEAGIHYHPKSIEWLHIETTYSTVTGKQSNGDYLPFIPAGKLNLNLMVKKEKLSVFRDTFISLNVSKAFSQDNPAPDETATDGYMLFDASVGGEFNIGKQPFMIKLSGTNLFDTKYTDHLSTLKEVNLYNPGRNISLSLSVPFVSKIAN
jgi:iron complex outermembrane receptor protein